MKQITLGQPQNQIALSGVRFYNDSMCVGTVDSLGRKGFVSKEDYSKTYVILSADGIRVGNNYPNYRKNLISDLMSDWLEKGNSLFLFETEKELFKWLSE